MNTNDTKQVALCFYCGEPLCWDSDFYASEVYPIPYNGDEDAIWSMFHCPNCGRSYEIIDPTKEEREKDYSNYWNTRNDK